MTRARLHPVVFTNVKVIDRTKPGAIAGFNFDDLAWGRWGEGALFAGAPPSATKMRANVVAGRTQTYQIYQSDPSGQPPHIAEQDEALFYTKIKATTRASQQVVSEILGNKHLQSTSWDIASRMLSPFETDIGYPLFFLSELVNSPYDKLRAISQAKNIDDMMHPFFLPDELTAHEQVEALIGIQDEIAQYTTANNWHLRFDLEAVTVI